MRERKVAYFEVSGHWLFEQLKEHFDIPKGTQYLDCIVAHPLTDSYDTVDFLVKNSKFTPIVSGEVPPRIYLGPKELKK